MTRKTLISKNKKIILGIILSVFLIISLGFLIMLKKYNYEFFLNKIQNESGFEINKRGEFTIDFFPRIHLIQKDLEISKTANNLIFISRDIILEIIKNYWDWQQTLFNFYSPSTVLNGIPFRNTSIKANYKNSNIEIIDFITNINEGKLSFDGNIKSNQIFEINLDGKFENISVTTLLNQSQQADWKRIKIKVRSNFHVDANGSNQDDLIKNLNANIPIHGLFYINATQEERFGTALLNILTEKIPELSGVSRSLNFLLTKYADIPSQIEGLILIENGILQTNNLMIKNDLAKMGVNMTYDILEDSIDGILIFYENEKKYLEAELKGSLSQPQILVSGKAFSESEDKEPLRDLKIIIEEGITNIFQKLLENNN